MASVSISISALVLTGVFLGSPFVEAASAMKVPSKLMKKLKSFEPSGMVYLPDLRQYLVSSDDTDKKETPWVFLMSESGEIDKSPSLIDGVTKMTDIESISVDGDGRIYFLSSLGVNKNGEELPTRNLFVQAEREDKDIGVLNAIDLRLLLVSAIKNSPLSELKSLAQNLEATLDVEASLVIDGVLYVGLKNPQPGSGKAVILNLGRVDDIFSNKEISTISIWKILDFAPISTKENTLSEMIFAGDNLFVSTTSEAGDGALWKLALTSQKLTLLKEFKGLKPEGLAYRPHENDLMVVFDQGEQAAQFQLIPNIL